MSVNSVLGKLANEKGAKAERRVLGAIGNMTADAWVLGARACTPEEDRRGIDIVVTTDVGELYVQVKSSKGGAKAFRNQMLTPTLIAVVVVRPGYSEQKVANVVRSELERLRAEVRSMRRGQ